MTESTLITFPSEAEWLAWKDNPGTYGASGVSAILGQSTYATRYDAWAERTGKVPPVDLSGNEAVEAGVELEESVLRWYAKRAGIPTRLVVLGGTLPAVITHPTDPRAYCSPDGIVRADDRLMMLGPVGERPLSELSPVGGVDGKCHGSGMAESEDPLNRYGGEGTEAVPRSIWWQCQWSCYSSGLPWWDVAALTGGRVLRLRVFRVHHAPEVTKMAAGVVERFHAEHVQADEPPTVSAKELALVEEATKRMWPESVDRVVAAGEVEGDLIGKLAGVEALQAHMDEIRTALVEAIKLRMGDADSLILPGAGKKGGPLTLATWRGGGKKDPAVDWKMTARALAESLAAECGTGPEEALKAHTLHGEPGVKARTFLPKARKKQLEPIVAALCDAGLVPTSLYEAATRAQTHGAVPWAQPPKTLTPNTES